LLIHLFFCIAHVSLFSFFCKNFRERPHYKTLLYLFGGNEKHVFAYF
jgi:hypothetical protein